MSDTFQLTAHPVANIRSLSVARFTLMRLSQANIRRLMLAVFLIETGCSSSGSDVSNDSGRIKTDPVPIYIVDDESERIHSVAASLNNPSGFTATYVYGGASCGCTAAEHDGKELAIGDKIEVAARGIETITLRSEIAYREGFYSDSAWFQTIDQPQRRVVIESPYGVVKSLRASPGALVFERKGVHGAFEAIAKVKFRYAVGSRNILSVLNVPKSIEWRATQQSSGIEKRLSTATDRYYEDEWIVAFFIQPDVRFGPSLQPHGEIAFLVGNAQKERLASKSLAYNAERLNKTTDRN